MFRRIKLNNIVILLFIFIIPNKLFNFLQIFVKFLLISYFNKHIYIKLDNICAIKLNLNDDHKNNLFTFKICSYSYNEFIVNIK